MDGLTWLFQIIMFLCLGLLVNPHEMLGSSGRGIAHRRIHDCHRTSAQRVPLPASVRETHQYEVQAVCVLGRDRGAVPIIFATYPVVAGVPGADVIFNIVFFITILLARHPRYYRL